MELDEGPPDHAKSTYGRRNMARARCVSPKSEPTRPPTTARAGHCEGRQVRRVRVQGGWASQLGAPQRSHPNTLPFHPERSTDSSPARL